MPVRRLTSVDSALVSTLGGTFASSSLLINPPNAYVSSDVTVHISKIVPHQSRCPQLAGCTAAQAELMLLETDWRKAKLEPQQIVTPIFHDEFSRMRAATLLESSSTQHEKLASFHAVNRAASFGLPLKSGFHVCVYCHTVIRS